MKCPYCKHYLDDFIEYGNLPRWDHDMKCPRCDNTMVVKFDMTVTEGWEEYDYWWTEVKVEVST